MCIAVKIGEFYRTRAGTKAYIAGRNPFDDKDPTNIFIGWVRENNGDTWPLTWNIEGHFDPALVKNAEDDLMEVWQDPVSVKFYVNILRSGIGVVYVGPETFSSYEAAEKYGRELVGSPKSMVPYVRTEEIIDTVIPSPQFVGAVVEEKETDDEESDAMTVAEFKELPSTRLIPSVVDAFA